MAIKDLFSKIVNKAENATEKAEETVLNAAAEVKDEAQGSIDGHMPPEPPKDENGNPVKPPEGMRPPMGRPPMGGNFPEPPKDENGNPVKPPEGMRPPFAGQKPSEDGSETEA